MAEVDTYNLNVILKLNIRCYLLSAYILVCFMSGSFGGSDGGMYSSSYGGDYVSRGSDVSFSSFLIGSSLIYGYLSVTFSFYCVLDDVGWWPFIFIYVFW